MKRCFKAFLAILFLLSCYSAFSQVSKHEKERQNIEKQRQKLLNDIDFTEKDIENTKKKKASSLNQLETYIRQISIREKLISTLNKELSLLTKQITEKKGQIQSLEKDLETLKEEYAKMIVAAYKTRSSYSKLLFLFSSDDFNDLVNRFKYIEKYAEYRKNQALLIEKNKNELAIKIDELQQKKTEKEQLLNNQKEQKKTLTDDKQEQNNLISSLQTKEQHLQDILNEKRKAKDKLQKIIADLIRKEIEEARRLATLEAKKNEKLSLTPEAAKLSADFTKNKGKLPWPVERGVIISTFGEHQHPVLKRVKTMNNGVDIKTTENAMVKALFNGTVAHVGFMPSIQNFILINHGAYFTVYSNLKITYVKEGDKVSTKQVIGKAYTNTDENKTQVHIEIWKSTSDKETTRMDPELWLYAP